MYDTDLLEQWICFRCGDKGEDIDEYLMENYKCSGCGEESIVQIKTLVDIANEIYLSHTENNYNEDCSS